MSRFLANIGTAIAIAILAQPVHAVILDWDAATWTSGSLSNSYDIDSAHPGNDISVAVAIGGGAILTSDPITGAASPTRNNTLAGGLTPAQNSLKISADLSSSTAYITITIDFAAFYPAGVENLSFTLFDIDLNGSSYRGQDEISSIVGLNGATSVAPTITGVGGSVTHSGTGVNQHLIGNADAVDTSSLGNAMISFANPVTSVSFRWDRGPDATGSAPTGSLALHDISFTPVPEVNPALTAAGLCAAGVVLRLCRRRRRPDAADFSSNYNCESASARGVLRKETPCVDSSPAPSLTFPAAHRSDAFPRNPGGIRSCARLGRRHVDARLFKFLRCERRRQQ